MNLKSEFKQYSHNILMQDFQEYCEYLRNRKVFLNLNKGDRIHLKDKWGVYIVLKRTKNKVLITCKKWQNEFNRGDKNYKELWTDNSNIHCRFGGFRV